MGLSVVEQPVGETSMPTARLAGDIDTLSGL
jgi:hypothetical protein